MTVSPRVAIVAPSLRILGGQSVQADRLIALLKQDGVDVRLVPIDPALPPWLRWIRRVPYLRTIVNQLAYLPSLVRLAEADVVHVFSASYWSFLLAPVPAMIAGRLFGKRVLLHYHSGEADDHLRHWGWLVHPWLGLAHEIVVPSRYLAQVFNAHGYSARPIPNVIDVSRFRFAGRQGRRLLSVRNLEPIYGVDVLIDAFAIVREAYPDASLTVAGIGSEAEALRQQAELVAPGAVRFVGRIEPAEMPQLYEQGDVFVNASTVDNQPVSILEAFASGLPVVTTPTGDIAWMVQNDETGVIVPDPDPAAFARAIESLLANPERANRLAQAAAEQLDRHTWRDVGPQWQQVYAPQTAIAPDAFEPLN